MPDNARVQQQPQADKKTQWIAGLFPRSQAMPDKLDIESGCVVGHRGVLHNRNRWIFLLRANPELLSKRRTTSHSRGNEMVEAFRKCRFKFRLAVISA
jgi:hypothetical protein